MYICAYVLGSNGHKIGLCPVYLCMWLYASIGKFTQVHF